MGSRSKSPRRRKHFSVMLWMRSFIAPEYFVLVLFLWFMIGLSLHVLISDIQVEPSKPGRLEALQMMRRRVMGGQNIHGDYHKIDIPIENILHDEKKKAHNAKKKNRRGTGLTQRQEFEEIYPPSDTQRIRNFVTSIRDEALDRRVADIGTKNVLPYDPMDCPDHPPPGYPEHYSLINVLEEWPVDDLQWPVDGTDESHPYLYHSLCIFDWDCPEHQQRAKAYQIDYDLPFLIRNHPEFLGTAERWMRDEPSYFVDMIDGPQRTEHSINNHLPFWRVPKHMKPPNGWVAPTENVEMTFEEWHEKSVGLERAIAAGEDHTQMDHWYFRLGGSPDHNRYLYDELPVFDPDQFEPGENIFMWEPENARGINCRWGMAGNIAEAHYDSGRNWIVLLGGGQRRYILAHPQECPNLALYPQPHPSGRHSEVDWSEIGKQPFNGDAGRKLANAQVFQVVLQASDALFLPTFWFHFIVSLNRNYQCNARSGATDTYAQYISDCGFPA